MLKCRDMLELGTAYLDDGLNRPELWAVRMHLLICPNCRAYIQKLKLTVNTVGELESYRTREGEVELILGRVFPQAGRAD